MKWTKFISIVLISFQLITAIEKTESVDPFSLFSFFIGTGLSLGFGAWSILDNSASNERQALQRNTLARIEEVQNGLHKLSVEMNQALADIKQILSVSPFLNKWWAMRIDFNGKMDGIYRDVRRSLSEVEKRLVIQEILSDRADTIHQLIQKMHDTLFMHGGGQLFNFMIEKIGEHAKTNRLPRDKLTFDFFLGMLSLELNARLAMEFQFSVVRKWHSDHAERETYEIHRSNQRIITLKSKFRQALADMRQLLDLSISRPAPTYWQGAVEWCVDDLYADVEDGYVIADVKLISDDIHSNPDKRQIRLDIIQRKLTARGMLDKTSTRIKWAKERCKKWMALDQFQPISVFLESSPSDQYALTKIQYPNVSQGQFQIMGVYTAFEFDNNGNANFLKQKVNFSYGKAPEQLGRSVAQGFPTFEPFVLSGFTILNTGWGLDVIPHDLDHTDLISDSI